MLLNTALQSETLSALLGYCSITAWLGAQFPQIITNFRTESVDGLALSFLANWLLGDVSNLIGCILTDQLPFQTYLATYFCFVDVCLVSQYLYYSPQFRFRKPTKEDAQHVEQGTHHRALSTESALLSSPELRRLSITAANLAVAAAAQEDEVIRQRVASVSRSPQRRRQVTTGTIHTMRGTAEEDEDRCDFVGALTESFHSEDSRRERKGFWDRPGASMTQHNTANIPVSGNTLALPQDPSGSQSVPGMASQTPSTATARGRALTRRLFVDPNITPGSDLERPPLGAQEVMGEESMIVESPVDTTQWRRSRSRRKPSLASRRGASIVFLGVWALFGIGRLAGTHVTPVDSGKWTSHHPISGKVLDPFLDLQTSTPLVRPITISHPVLYTSSQLEYDLQEPHPPHSPHRPPPERKHLPLKRIIGRISAWVCATLYLTSRMPQIWKNYARQSVEGLSMILFIAAFMGNFFYVFSILTNPLMDAPPIVRDEFIRETIPYLIGSGGTLLFDVTIVSQSIVYKGRRPRTGSVYAGSKRRSVYRTASGTGVYGPGEEEALLASAMEGGNVMGGATAVGASMSGRKRYGSTIHAAPGVASDTDGGASGIRVVTNHENI